MLIKTESGSSYKITGGICRKYNDQGLCIDAFKVISMKSVPNEGINTFKDVFDLPQSKPEIGKRIHIAGFDSDWLSTLVVSIEYGEDDER